ncbi:DUF5343 domain-containing protein [Nocardioides anomalus]|uniref:DUF5343 domain-containing protein n=1 Tax=Nocardioides anomalus TaxID=2712223 RepID=A0A6G6WGA0_9ACTN|nr:DUF5343 domain-containing protein [Nocardioides anomalus]QIG44236.1 DUF5343 domain-containing protein [Nocardioides anomalus]
MADLPYVLNTGTLSKFFDTMVTTGTPSKVTVKYLESIGFKSSNDRYLTSFLKDLGFVDASGTPTDRWRDYRHTGESKSVMAAAVRDGWRGLFELYPDADRRDDEAIRNWMRTRSPSASPTVVDRSLKSFRSASALADFDAGVAAAAQEEAASAPVVSATVPTIPTMPRQATPEVIINIQLEVPATDNPDTYDRFFAAMKKHLFPDES